jgi:hypothetical protein
VVVDRDFQKRDKMINFFLVQTRALAWREREGELPLLESLEDGLALENVSFSEEAVKMWRGRLFSE